MANTVGSRKKTIYKQKSEKQMWIDKFKIVVSKTHIRNIDKICEKLIKKSSVAKSSIISRSKKYGVKCDITLNDIRKMILETYGTMCKYDKTRILNYKNMVFDHIMPISKGGESTKDNIQVISRFSNNMKGSLTEESFLILLNWLNTIDPKIKKDISIRLARGIH